MLGRRRIDPFFSESWLKRVYGLTPISGLAPEYDGTRLKMGTELVVDPNFRIYPS